MDLRLPDQHSIFDMIRVHSSFLALVGMILFAFVSTRVFARVLIKIHARFTTKDFGKYKGDKLYEIVSNILRTANSLYVLQSGEHYLGCDNNACIMVCITPASADEFLARHPGTCHDECVIPTLFYSILPFTQLGRIDYVLYTSPNVDACLRLQSEQLMELLLQRKEVVSIANKAASFFDPQRQTFSLIDIATGEVATKEGILSKVRRDAGLFPRRC